MLGGESLKHGGGYIGISRWNDVTFSRCTDKLESRMRQFETEMKTERQRSVSERKSDQEALRDFLLRMGRVSAETYVGI